MREYFIELRLESGDMMTVICKDETDYNNKTAMLERDYPHLDWKERRE